MDQSMRSMRDQFVSHEWAKLLYNGMYFSPEREWLDSMSIQNEFQ